MYPKSLNRHKALFYFLFSLTLLSINSCKKTDTLVSIEKKEAIKEIPENFFKLPDNLSPILKRIARELERQNYTKEFITAFIAKEGFPIWAKSRIKKHKLKTANFDGEGLEDTVVYIPLVVSAQKYVTGFLKAIVDDSVEIKIFRQNDYINFPFKTPSSSTSITTAEEYAIMMMTMDRDVYGTTEFKIPDDRLFHNSTDYSDTVGLERYIVLNDSTGMGGEGFADGTTISNYQYEVCWTANSYRYVCNTFNGSGNTPNVVGCEWVHGTVTVCTTYETGGEGPGGPGGGGGSGGGGTWPFPPSGPGGGGAPCQEEFGKSIKNSFTPIECNPSGGNPWPARDAHGYLYSRLSEMRLKLSQNPFALEPCDSLNLMPLDPFNSYGMMYQRVAQSTPTQYVKERIDSIAGVAPNWYIDNFYSTNFDNAYGPLVNCDFFPVRITQMPNGFTPASLLEYFRKNINQFIDSNVNVSFEPYSHGSFNDSARYNASGVNSLGALVHLDMINDGSVILSNYYSNSTTQKHRFTFSTMETPLDFSHPVAGNREFGIYPSTDIQNPNDFVFYTMGVDRLNDWVFSTGDWVNQRLGSPSGFEMADQLWANIQKNMISFINNPANGGSAQYYGPPASVRARPQYNHVDDYLKNLITWEELLILLGC